MNILEIVGLSLLEFGVVLFAGLYIYLVKYKGEYKNDYGWYDD